MYVQNDVKCEAVEEIELRIQYENREIQNIELTDLILNFVKDFLIGIFGKAYYHLNIRITILCLVAFVIF